MGFWWTKKKTKPAPAPDKMEEEIRRSTDPVVQELLREKEQLERDLIVATENARKARIALEQVQKEQRGKPGASLVQQSREEEEAERMLAMCNGTMIDTQTSIQMQELRIRMAYLKAKH